MKNCFMRSYLAGRELHSLIMKSSYTITEVAQVLDIPRATLSSWTSARVSFIPHRNKIHRDVLDKLSSLLGLNAETIERVIELGWQDYALNTTVHDARSPYDDRPSGNRRTAKLLMRSLQDPLITEEDREAAISHVLGMIPE